MRIVKHSAMLVLGWVAFAAAGGFCQDAAEQLRFEAASVKLHTSASPSTGRTGIEETPGLIRIENLNLRAVIANAFQVKDFQISGPGWLGAEAVDITAKPPEGYRREQLPMLLRNLLADRFHLAVHHESKEIAAYALVVAKGGSKLREATKPRDYLTGRAGLIQCSRLSTKDLVTVLSRVVGRPVIDSTGLTGAYEVKLEWTPDQMAAAPAADRSGDAPDPGVSLLTALSDQLGLRLQPTRVAADVVVVDRMDRVPAEN